MAARCGAPRARSCAGLPSGAGRALAVPPPTRAASPVEAEDKRLVDTEARSRIGVPGNKIVFNPPGRQFDTVIMMDCSQ